MTPETESIPTHRIVCGVMTMLALGCATSPPPAGPRLDLSSAPAEAVEREETWYGWQIIGLDVLSQPPLHTAATTTSACARSSSLRPAPSSVQGSGSSRP